MPDWEFLSRYLAGEYKGVWEELQSLGEIVEPSLKTDALAVARETMKRVCANLDMIVHRLRKLGFEFEQSDRVFVPAKPNALQFLDRFEQQWGILPFSVRAWYECVHSVNLIASKSLSKNLIKSLDPIFIALSFSSSTKLADEVLDADELRWYIQGINFLSLEESLKEVLQSQEKFKRDWEQGKVDEWTRNYYLERGIDPTISPSNINFLPVGMSMSTCEPMGFKVGFASADCVMRDDNQEIRFVDFLREQLLFEQLLSGHCAKNQQYNYLYIGRLPDHSQVASEITRGLFPF